MSRPFFVFRARNGIIIHLLTKSASWLINRSDGTASVEEDGLLRVQLSKILTAHRVEAAVFAGTTPFAAFSSSPVLTGPAKRRLVVSRRGASLPRERRSLFLGGGGCTNVVVSSHVIRDIFRTHFKFTYVIRIIRVQKNSVVENGVAYS